MEFKKVEGCGNHFILIDEFNSKHSQISYSPHDIRNMCQVNYGVGADGVLIVRAISEQYHLRTVNFEMVVYNADGSLAQMCGNGLRCVAQYLYQNYKPFLSHSLTSEYIKTGSGVLEVLRSEPTLDGHSVIGVKMGWPSIQEIVTYGERNFNVISLGNPHVVTFNLNDYIHRVQLATTWKDLLKDGINISFARLTEDLSIDLEVHERGCGWTLACGTGACATVFHGYQQGLFKIDEQVKVHLPGGVLFIDITSAGLVMWGPAKIVFSGTYELSSN